MTFSVSQIYQIRLHIATLYNLKMTSLFYCKQSLPHILYIYTPTDFWSPNLENRISLILLLSSVAEAKARILGPSDLHVKAGSTITLTCIINQGPHDLGTVFWYKGDNILETSEPHINDADYLRRLTIQVSLNHLTFLHRPRNFVQFYYKTLLLPTTR